MSDIRHHYENREAEDNRTVAEVMRQRTEDAVVGGCCDRFADNKGCDCLERAQERERKRYPWTAPSASPIDRLFAERQAIMETAEKEIKLLREQNKSLAERVAAQSELLAKRADKDETPIDQHEGKKYLRTIVGATDFLEFLVFDGKQLPVIQIDVYKVLAAFEVTSAPIAHAIKKLLAPGQRGKGDLIADLKGVISAASRAIEEEKVRVALKKE